ncbi:hypothetical protein Y1Q_0015259 [Alligator mississippiensis]|uniref:Secreted protein n=1 Tax=Alligator mississippiensis TaxID=8496 RepID=A0A151NL51_ALLMI|nr:hypothetical protein Y1Q_0015259 [Alligator mississippiensis]
MLQASSCGLRLLAGLCTGVTVTQTKFVTVRNGANFLEPETSLHSGQQQQSTARGGHDHEPLSRYTPLTPACSGTCSPRDMV